MALLKTVLCICVRINQVALNPVLINSCVHVAEVLSPVLIYPPVQVDEGECAGERPGGTEPCTSPLCPVWRTGNWSKVGLRSFWCKENVIARAAKDF